jgi:GT2 family glycosyltransferase
VPDITVYMPAYNVAQFLPRAIASLLAQALAPAETLVIDDGSQDDSPMIARRFSRDLRACRFLLLPLDVRFLACLPYRDFRLWPSNGKLLNESAAGA